MVLARFETDITPAIGARLRETRFFEHKTFLPHAYRASMLGVN